MYFTTHSLLCINHPSLSAAAVVPALHAAWGVHPAAKDAALKGVLHQHLSVASAMAALRNHVVSCLCLLSVVIVGGWFPPRPTPSPTWLAFTGRLVLTFLATMLLSMHAEESMLCLLQSAGLLPSSRVHWACCTCMPSSLFQGSA